MLTQYYMHYMKQRYMLNNNWGKNEETQKNYFHCPVSRAHII
jgi:hypothetical protein